MCVCAYVPYGMELLRPRYVHVKKNVSRSTLQQGQRVLHQRFGEGEVLSIEAHGRDRAARVHFARVGEKKLILKFAKLQILD